MEFTEWEVLKLWRQLTEVRSASLDTHAVSDLEYEAACFCAASKDIYRFLRR